MESMLPGIKYEDEMFFRLNKRRRKLLGKMLSRIQLNGDLWRYGWNHFRKMRLDRDKSLVMTYPTNAMIELGNVCNLHCRMCPREHEYGKAMDVGFMPLDKAMRIVDEIYPYLDSIGLTGLGETILYPHLLEIVRYIKSKKKSIVITISTNAHFKGYKERIEPLLPYIDNIQFSIDGVGDTYDAIRQGASFQEVSDNIRFTMEKGKSATFMLNCVVMPENYFQMKEVAEYARQMHIEYVNFNAASIVANPKETRDYYRFFRTKEYLDALEAMRAYAGEHPDMEITGIDAPGDDGTFHDCIYPWEYPYITWDGFYVPCCGKPFPKLLNFGNVFDSGVMEVLNGKKAQAFRKLWQQNTPPSFCHNCQLTTI